MDHGVSHSDGASAVTPTPYSPRWSVSYSNKNTVIEPRSSPSAEHVSPPYRSHSSSNSRSMSHPAPHRLSHSSHTYTHRHHRSIDSHAHHHGGSQSARTVPTTEEGAISQLHNLRLSMRTGSVGHSDLNFGSGSNRSHFSRHRHSNNYCCSRGYAHDDVDSTNQSAEHHIPSYVTLFSNDHAQWPLRLSAGHVNKKSSNPSNSNEGNLLSMLGTDDTNIDSSSSNHAHKSVDSSGNTTNGSPSAHHNSTGYYTGRHRKAYPYTSHPVQSNHTMEHHHHHHHPVRESSIGTRPTAETARDISGHSRNAREDRLTSIASCMASHTRQATDEEREDDASINAGYGAMHHANSTMNHTFSSLRVAQGAAAAAAAAHTFTLPLLLDLVPPFRFGLVEDGVYRGAYPILRNFPFLRERAIRTILSLTPEPPSFDLDNFAAQSHITLTHIQADRFKGEVQLLPAQVSDALHVLLDARMHPVYFHCLDGRHVTGLVVMALRKLQQWGVPAMHAEYQRVTREVSDEVSFVTDYSGPVRVPVQTPSWWDLGQGWEQSAEGGSGAMASHAGKRTVGNVKLLFPPAVPRYEEKANQVKDNSDSIHHGSSNNYSSARSKEGVPVDSCINHKSGGDSIDTTSGNSAASLARAAAASPTAAASQPQRGSEAAGYVLIDAAALRALPLERRVGAGVLSGSSAYPPAVTHTETKSTALAKSDTSPGVYIDVRALLCNSAAATDERSRDRNVSLAGAGSSSASRGNQTFMTDDHKRRHNMDVMNSADGSCKAGSIQQQQHLSHCVPARPCVDCDLYSKANSLNNSFSVSSVNEVSARARAYCNGVPTPVPSSTTTFTMATPAVVAAASLTRANTLQSLSSVMHPTGQPPALNTSEPLSNALLLPMREQQQHSHQHHHHGDVVSDGVTATGVSYASVAKAKSSALGSETGSGGRAGHDMDALCVQENVFKARPRKRRMSF